jgi:DNA-binding SARP family transcriptional activator
VLGPLRIHVDGRQLNKGLRTKAIELLAYLLVHPAGVTRDAAIEALWPELDPDHGVA